jgi:hypothetical protein
MDSLNNCTEIHGEDTENHREKLCETQCSSVQLCVIRMDSLNDCTEIHGEDTENQREKLCETQCSSVQLRVIIHKFYTN